MSATIAIDTERLRLRQWRPEDLEPFAALNADPRVMEFFPSTIDRAASEAAVARWQTQIERRGWGLWAVQTLDTGEFIGFVGLQIPHAELPFNPCVEVGWRLAFAHWGRGYATEAARAALRVGFEELDLDEIVSFASVLNWRSRAVMQRLGMQEAPQTFNHPSVPAGSPLREHCLYRLTRTQWLDREREVSRDTSHVPAPIDLTEESVAGEEDPGAALDDMMEPPPPPPARRSG